MLTYIDTSARQGNKRKRREREEEREEIKLGIRLSITNKQSVDANEIPRLQG